MVQLRTIVFMLTVLNLLNWVDRGLIAGAGTLIKGCVVDVDHCGHQPELEERCPDDPDDSHKQINTCSSRCRVCGDVCKDSGELVEQTGFGMNDFALGLVQSSFMIGYMCGSFLFSRAAHGARVYRVLGYGMIVWTISALISGSSGFLKEYEWSRYVLTLGRVLSGVGEAALATVAIPHLDDVLPESVKGRYLALYFSAMPIGNALGFVFAGVVSEFLTWKWTFFIEAMMMPPFIALFLFHPDLQKYKVAQSERRKAILTAEVGLEEGHNSHNVRLLDEGESTEIIAGSQEFEANVTRTTATSSGADDEDKTLATLWQEIMMCLNSRTFVLASAGLAMFTFTAAGLAFYMPQFLQMYRPCDKSWKFSETKADEAFGVMVLTSGFLGVLLGGFIIDISLTENHVAHSLKYCAVELAAASVFLGIAVFTTNVVVFFVLAWIGTLLAFATTAPVNRALLGAVPVEARSIAMALSVVIAHLFGDVPSPILIGAISDARSPVFALGTAWFGFLLGTVFWVLALFASVKSPALIIHA